MDETTMINQENNIVAEMPQTATVETVTEEKVVAFQQPVNEEKEKPYTFRKFKSPDVFPMFKLVGKIGINEFTKCFEKDGVKDLIKSFTGENNDKSASIVGVSVMLEAANVILCNLPKCEGDIYSILSNTSNLTVDEIKELDLAVFTEMIIDFVKKDDFKDFFKVVSKLFK